ncbi:acyl carrier protein, partial [Salmonella enterica subsp. enterica serovar Heidelberg]
MVDNIEQQVYELVRPYAGTYLFNIKQVELTPEIDLDTDL